MARPALVTVQGTYLKLDGTPEKGSVSFTSATFARHSASDDVVTPGTRVVHLDAGGELSIVLPSTDDPAWSPVGWTYAVSVRLSEFQTTFNAVIPYDAPSGVLDLSELLPVSVAGGSLYAAFSHSHDQLSAALTTHEVDTTSIHGITDTSLLRTFPSSALIASMGTPVRTAHRGGGSANGSVQVGPVPENTLVGARAIVEAAQALNITNFVLNVQCRLLRDGTVVVMHDATWDRTTTTSGNVADYSAQHVAGLSIDASTYTTATAFGNSIPVPLLDDYLREFGGKVALNIAAYQGTAGIGQAVVNHVTRAGIQRTVMLSSFQTAELTAAKAAGIATMYYPPAEGQAGATAAEILATNVWATGLTKYVGIDLNSTDAYIATLVAAGLHVSVYSTDRRWERDYYVTTLGANGVQGLISDDPIYQFTDVALHGGTVDPYTLGAWPHGHLESDLSHGRGQLHATKGLVLDNVSNTQFCVDGSRCPIATPTAYTITGVLTPDSNGGDTTRAAQLALCAPDDRVTSGVPNTGAGVVDGYSLLWRWNGNVELWENTRSGQGNTKVGSTLSSTALSPGVGVPFTLQVTPTQIIFTRTDNAATITWTNGNKRGPYYHRGKNGGATTTNLGVSWKITNVA